MSQLELVRDALTIKKLAREVPMSTVMLARVDKMADAFLDANLPKVDPKPEDEPLDGGTTFD